MTMNDWFVYIVSCADDTFYTGITKDVERRIREHNEDNKLASKYTKSRRPVMLMYYEVCASRSSASKREYEIKCMTRKEKEYLSIKTR